MMIANKFIRRFFATVSDPYYILGVDRNAPFHAIKVAYYKLANEYHPDKNSSPEANKKFILVKEAFEAIKLQKGLVKPQNLYPSTTADSIRPNPEKFTPDDDEDVKSQRDYRVEKQKTEQSQQYQSFNTSFKTIYDINQIKIKVEKGQVKDASSRFGLEKYRVKIQKYSNNSFSYLIIFGLGLVFILSAISYVYKKADYRMKEQAINRFSKTHQRKTLLSQASSTYQAEMQIMSLSPEIKQIAKEEYEKMVKAGINLKKKPEIISSKNIESV